MRSPMNFQAAIFDMDGLLLDTERVCMRVFKQACETLNLTFHEEIYLSIIGRNASGIELILRQAYGDNFPQLHSAWRLGYDAEIKHRAIEVKAGVIELLEWLKHHKVPTAVATSTQKELASIKLKLAGLDHYFDLLTAGCEVSQGKPDPEIYLLAAQRLGVDPTKCLAFEDSNNGARSAVAAGMRTYQVPDLVSPSEEVLALGHVVIPSLREAIRVITQDAHVFTPHNSSYIIQ